MLNIIAVAVGLAADMPEFRRLIYTGRRPVVFRGGGKMKQYIQLMAAGETSLLMLPGLPDAPQNVVPVSDVLLAVYPGGICWSGTRRNADGTTGRWESYTVPPEVLERVAGQAAQ